MLLEKIKKPSDLKKISRRKLILLSKEIRQRIIQVVSKTGGHLASSLGTVDLTIALHYCLDLPKDKIIWDVGHQIYAHKLLTGRNENFDTLRQMHGISGFPTVGESECDVFTTGHSSTAISLALGLVAARDLNETKEKVVAVVGDGSLTGGVCFEALNNSGHLNKDLLVVLNTNEMSIAPSVGALTNYLNKIISQPIYNRFRKALETFIKTRIPLVGSRILKISSKFEESLKGLIVPGIFFEELGFRYFGPLDGHNIELLIKTLKNILPLKGPRILHIVTKKGKGYKPAEDKPVMFHSASAFDIDTGFLKSEPDALTYTKVFGQTLVKLAQKDKRIVAITAAMPDGTGLSKFRDLYPDRFFDVGIAEQHAVCFAAGLAKKGFRPVVAIYSTFLQRAYDQIIEEVSLQNLPVILAIDRAGIVEGDGVTHQGIFDIAYLRNLPNITVMAPKDGDELSRMVEFAVTLGKPVAIRYPKDQVAAFDTKQKQADIKLGKFEILREGKDLAIIALGSMVYPSLCVAEELVNEGIGIQLVNARFANPLDEDALRGIARNFKKILVIEEGVFNGGFAMAVLERINSFRQKTIKSEVKTIGLPSEFITHGKRDVLLSNYGLDKKGIIKSIRDFLIL